MKRGIVASSYKVPAGGSFTPADLSPHSWWDVSLLSSVSFHSGSPTGPVTQLRDISGNAHHLNNTDAPSSPDRSGTMNGLATLVAAPGDQLEAYWDSAPNILNQPITVAWAGIVPGSGFPTVFDNPYGNAFTVWHNQDGHIWQETATGTPFSAAHAGGTADCFVHTFNGSSSVMRQNGSVIATGDNGTTQLLGFRLTRARFGGASDGGTLGEIVIVNRVLTGGETTSLESYIKTKWGTL